MFAHYFMITFPAVRKIFALQTCHTSLMNMKIFILALQYLSFLKGQDSFFIFFFTNGAFFAHSSRSLIHAC